MVTLRGTLTARKILIGQICVASVKRIEVSGEAYEGLYDVESSTVEQTLHTANKLMKQDIIIKPIPYSETSNNADGITVFIGKERDL